TGVHRLRARERNRLPHLYGDRAGPLRRAVQRVPAQAHTQGPAAAAARVAQGRIPGLTRAAIDEAFRWRVAGERRAPRARAHRRWPARCLATTAPRRLVGPPRARPAAGTRARRISTARSAASRARSYARLRKRRSCLRA